LHAEQAQILELRRTKAEADAREAVVRRRRDALETQVEAVVGLSIESNSVDLVELDPS
jgi:hypothetical protein